MSDSHERFEQLIARVLRDQPPLQAPASLEANVLREIERRAALPWWRKGFASWPQLARVALLLALAGVVKLALEALVWITTNLRGSPVATAIEEPVDSLHAFSSVAKSLGTAAQLLVSAIPSLWLYAGLVLGGAMYVALFGVGAALYRTLNK
jgi:hypothetical protein